MPLRPPKKQWLADHLQVRGRLMLDEGAARALREEGKSLLPIGVFDLSGEFERGRGGHLHRPRRSRDRPRIGSTTAPRTRVKCLGHASGESRPCERRRGRTELVLL